jgi:hypothetical protein
VRGSNRTCNTRLKAGHSPEGWLCQAFLLVTSTVAC